MYTSTCIKAALRVIVFAVAVTMFDEDGTSPPMELAVDLPQGFSLDRPVSLSSRRLTAPVMRTIAMALDLPATGSKEETLQIVEGNLADQGHEALNVQVAIQATEDPQRLMLQLMDAEGAFVEMILLTAAESAPVESGGEGRAGADEPGDTGGEKEGGGAYGGRGSGAE